MQCGKVLTVKSFGFFLPRKKVFSGNAVLHQEFFHSWMVYMA